MGVTQIRDEGLKREFEIALTAKEIAKKMDARLAHLATQVQMPGFRAGKVPVSIVKARYGKQVQGEVIQNAIDEAASGIFKEKNIRPAVQPSLDITEYKEGGDLKAVLAVEVLPEIAKVDVKALKVERFNVEISKKEVDGALQELVEQNRPTKPIAKPRGVKDGDTVVMDFIGRIDGEAFDGGSAEGHQLKIGSNRFIPGFEDGLIGAKADTSIEVKVPFPADYPAKHLAGKDGVFEVKIHEILEDDADAKIDDALAKNFGMDSLDALKDAIKKQMQQQHQGALRNATKTSILDSLDEVCGAVEVPETLEKQEYEAICRQLFPQDPQKDLGKDSGKDSGKDAKTPPAADAKMSDADKKDARLMALRRVRLGMVLMDIGRQNDLQVTDEERNRAIHTEAQKYPGQQQEVLDYFKNNPQAVQQLMGPIIEDKVIDFILELAQVSDKTISVEKLYAEDDIEAMKQKSRASAKKSPPKSAAKKAPAKKPAAKKTAAKKTATK